MNYGKYERIMALLSGILIAVAIYSVFFMLPVMKDESGNVLDQSFNIFYFHMPIAILSYLAFAVVFIASIQYLRTRDVSWDILAKSSAEIGLVFAFLVLATGSIWAKQVWGWYWVWEPRLTTSLVLFLVYAVYLLLRNSIDDMASRARLSSVFGIAGFASVPLSFFSIRLWRSAHPLMFGDALYGQSGGGLEGSTLQFVLLINFAAFISLYVTLLIYKLGNEHLRESLEELKNS
ncbi:cytochrome c biogenesis protein [Methanohalophilus levihalophilus]|uniref:cytochrome c biogenesis protein n=1 Tax=Methanohalophilus levihalophilus TaxID=1431282 RepID=UPI001AEA5E19|nr:cytochrome c biogenesis protein [Methanohalophilus levihalophilus]